MAITTKQQSVPPIAVVRHDYRADEVRALFDQPFFDLLHQAHTVHRHCFDANRVQLSTLLNIKTGACPEDCAYCPQSAHHHADLTREQLMSLHDVTNAAEDAKANGATRFCMGAAWRNPTDKNLDRVIEMIKAVKALGMETCVTLGMLTDAQARRLKDAGLDYYNHNIDTSEDYYDEIISTRTFSDRLQTLAHVRDAGMNVCCGGIVGMGERIDDRAEMLRALANLPTHPQSVPINRLVAVPGTPLADAVPVDEFDFIRTIAVARIIMPHAYVRLSAGRETMSDTMQALALYAGANSIFYGEKLLTTPNAGRDHDNALFARLGVRAEAA